MPLGFKAFDIYGQIHLDKDELRQAMRGLPGDLGPDADKAGNALGKRMSDSLAKAVEASSARLAKARRAEQTATEAVKLAELRLAEARDKGNVKGSQLLALEQRLEQANRRLADSHTAVATATTRHAEAERRLAEDVDNIAKKALPNADRGGRDIGDKLSQGIHLSIVRNSPLIVAGVSAALSAGGPAVLTAATGLFAGIGIVAAAQSQKVQSAWKGTWDEVKAGAIADASVIEPTLVRVAGNVGAAFERMRPQVRDAFAAANPQIDVFSNGLIRLATNALPGLVRAVEGGMPVTRGFADFLAKTGTGLTDFFDRITAHAPAAGQVWSQLGTTMDTLLPILGELIGQGAELGTQILPLLNGSLGLVLSVVTKLNGVLPIAVGYFGAMKIISMVGGWATSAGAALGKLGAQDIPLVSAAASKMGGALTTAGGAAAAGGPVVAALALTVGLLMAAHQESEQRIRTWTQALNEGGKAAGDARAEMAAHDAQVRQLSTGFMGFISQINGTAGVLKMYGAESAKARQASADYLASLNPLEAAQRRASIASDDLANAIRRFGPGSAEATSAAQRYKDAQHDVEVQEARTQQAIHGVTQAMLDQANQALAAVDSNFAYQDATYRVADAQKALDDAIRQHGPSSDEATRATTALGEALSAQAQAAGRAAANASGLTDKMDLQKVSAAGTLKELYALRDQYGSNLPASLQTAITNMEAAGVKLDWLGQKKPTPVVDADINPLTGKTQTSFNMLDVLGGKRPTPVADLTLNPFSAAYNAVMGQVATLSGQRPTPSAGLYTGIFSSAFNAAMGNIATLAGQRPNPVAYLSVSGTSQVDAAINYAARNRTSTIFVYNRQMGAALALGGKVGDAVRRFDVGGSPRRRQDGRISGPGGPWDDMVRAVTDTGEPIRVANSEWIVKGVISAQQGDAKMRALNEGRADIVMRAGRSPSRYATSVPAAAPGSTATATAPSRTVVVQRVDVHLQGFDIRDRGEVRRFARELRQALIDLDKEQS